MITVRKEKTRKIQNFWSHCLFHPTDAVEDSWGRRILDRMARDGSIKSIRIYAMLEDIVYLDENDELAFDFRVSDLRLDYLIGLGFDLLIAYAGMPDCIAEQTQKLMSNSKRKTRYKGKLFNTNLPRDFALWEEVCYRYTLHNIERYGIERMSSWRFTCFNEPDCDGFFLSNVSGGDIPTRVEAYTRLYEAFARGVRRAFCELKIGGPALACSYDFLDGFLKALTAKNLPIDFIALHDYGTDPKTLNAGKGLRVGSILRRHTRYFDIIEANGYADKTIIVDEWGASCLGYHNKEECPALMFRESEIYSAYYTKLIHQFIAREFKVERMMICLSGQHEMVEDFSGFRNFFTLNFFAKPIYNAYLMASKLGDTLLSYDVSDENVFVIPTKKEDGSYAVMLTYASETFDEGLPTVEKTLVLPEDAVGKEVTVYVIDKAHTNPYRVWERMGMPEIEGDVLTALKDESRLKPLASYTTEDSTVSLTLTANATYLVSVH